MRKVQSSPLIFTGSNHPVWLGDTYKGQSAFLILNGPSLLNFDLSYLDNPGFVTMGVNNGPKTYRPNLWVSVDDPRKFLKSIWLDPKIMKFVPNTSLNKKLYDSEEMKEIDVYVRDCPNVYFFNRNNAFKAESFLTEPTVNWGNTKDGGGGRSVMLVALRILHYLGIRTVFLLGCDFKMEEGKKNYHFAQDRNKGAVNGNNYSYKKNIERFELLKPIFEQEGYLIFNCNPESELTVFPAVDYGDAIKTATHYMPKYLEFERTFGLYEITENKKEKK